MHLKSEAGCQKSTLIFDFFYGEGVSMNIHEQYIKDGKVLAHLGCHSKVFADLTPCCGLEVQKPTQVLQSVKGPGNIFD
jgi:hypothetical protein